MPEEQDQSQKTEDATPKRLEESRKKGQVPSSKEPSTALAFLILASLGLTGAGAFVVNQITNIMHNFFSGKVTFDLNGAGIQELLITLLSSMAAIILPIVIPVMILGALATVLVTGPVFSFKAITPKFEKISPLKGLKRMFSTRALSEFVKSLLKLSVISLACWFVITDLLPLAITSVRSDPVSIAHLATDGSLKLIALVAIIFFFIAVFDVLYQRWEYAKSQRMAQKEVRDEHKEVEGDPMIKAKIKQIQLEQSRKRMMADVPEADVIITNPTHLAIALSYKPGSPGAPRVVAKGRGKVAEKIREIARKHGIEIRQNIELARSLFKSVKVGSEIPEHLYEAVAIIMAEMYRARSEKA